jgi:putative sterol carrier protein
MSNPLPSVEQIMEGMKSAFQADKAAGVDAVVQYSLTGEGGGDFYLTIKNGTLEMAQGKAASPKLTLTIAKQDFLDMTSGKLNAMAAFSSGKLKLGGDMMFAMKLAPMFGRAS